MKIAIVGAGYAGSAMAWHLLRRKCSVTVFDGGWGASHASTGLLHPAPGKKAQPTWRAQEGMQATRKLLEVAGSDTFVNNGLLRFGIESEGIVVFSKKYLLALKRACHEAHWVQHWVQDREELKAFDQVIFTSGAETLFWGDLPLKKAIGQCLVCRCPEPLTFSLLGEGHITPTEEPGICLVGSTYEHTEKPDPKKALALLDQVAKFYPLAKEFQVIDILCGTRIAPKVGYRPIVEQISSKEWVFTGLGSRGLIYHSLLAEEIAAKICGP